MEKLVMVLALMGFSIHPASTFSGCRISSHPGLDCLICFQSSRIRLQILSGFYCYFGLWFFQTTMTKSHCSLKFKCGLLRFLEFSGLHYCLFVKVPCNVISTLQQGIPRIAAEGFSSMPGTSCSAGNMLHIFPARQSFLQACLLFVVAFVSAATLIEYHMSFALSTTFLIFFKPFCFLCRVKLFVFSRWNLILPHHPTACQQFFTIISLRFYN